MWWTITYTCFRERVRLSSLLHFAVRHERCSAVWLAEWHPLIVGLDECGSGNILVEVRESCCSCRQRAIPVRIVLWLVLSTENLALLLLSDCHGVQQGEEVMQMIRQIVEQLHPHFAECTHDILHATDKYIPMLSALSSRTS